MNTIFDNLVELKCEYCGNDLFHDGKYRGNMVEVSKEVDGMTEIFDYYFCCKQGKCDRELQAKFIAGDFYVGGFIDLPSLSSSNFYLKHIITFINQLHDKEHYSYSKDALDKEKKLIMALGQIVLKEVTENERKHFNELFSLGL